MPFFHSSFLLPPLLFTGIPLTIRYGWLCTVPVVPVRLDQRETV